MSAPVLNPERLRILQAAADKRLSVNPAGRYVIAHEKRPQRQDREYLLHKGYISWSWRSIAITDKGLAVLEKHS